MYISTTIWILLKLFYPMALVFHRPSICSKCLYVIHALRKFCILEQRFCWSLLVRVEQTPLYSTAVNAFESKNKKFNTALLVANVLSHPQYLSQISYTGFRPLIFAIYFLWRTRNKILHKSNLDITMNKFSWIISINETHCFNGWMFF